MSDFNMNLYRVGTTRDIRESTKFSQESCIVTAVGQFRGMYIQLKFNDPQILKLRPRDIPSLTPHEISEWVKMIMKIADWGFSYDFDKNIATWDPRATNWLWFYIPAIWLRYIDEDPRAIKNYFRLRQYVDRHTALFLCPLYRKPECLSNPLHGIRTWYNCNNHRFVPGFDFLCSLKDFSFDEFVLDYVSKRKNLASDVSLYSFLYNSRFNYQLTHEQMNKLREMNGEQQLKHGCFHPLWNITQNFDLTPTLLDFMMNMHRHSAVEINKMWMNDWYSPMEKEFLNGKKAHTAIRVV